MQDFYSVLFYFLMIFFQYKEIDSCSVCTLLSRDVIIKRFKRLLSFLSRLYEIVSFFAVEYVDNNDERYVACSYNKYTRMKVVMRLPTVNAREVFIPACESSMTSSMTSSLNRLNGENKSHFFRRPFQTFLWFASCSLDSLQNGMPNVTMYSSQRLKKHVVIRVNFF